MLSNVLNCFEAIFRTKEKNDISVKRHLVKDANIAIEKQYRKAHSNGTVLVKYSHGCIRCEEQLP